MRAPIPILLLWLLAGPAWAQSVARTYTTGGTFSVFNHVVFSPDGRTGYVAMASLNQVVAFDPFTGVVTRRATVGSQPGKIGLSGDGRRLAVVNTGSDTVSVIDTASFAVVATAFFPGADLIGENNVTFNLDGSRAFVTDDRLSNLWVFNPQPGSGAIIRILDLGDGPGSSQLSPDGRNLLIPTTRGSKIINFIDASTLVPRPSFLTGESFSQFNNVVFSTSNTAFVASFRTARLLKLDLAGFGHSGATTGLGPAKVGVSSGGIVGVANSLSDTVSLADNFGVFGTVFPGSADFSEQNDPVFSSSGLGLVPSFGTGEVVIFNPATASWLGNLRLGGSPTHLSADPQRRLGVVVNPGTGTLSTLLLAPATLNFPILKGTSASFTSFAVLNSGTSAADTFFTALTTSGGTAVFPRNPKFETLLPSQQTADLDTEIFNADPAAPREGWVQVNSTGTVKGFSLVGEDSLRALDGAVASSAASSELFFTRLAGASSSLGTAVTEIHLVNPGLRPAAVELKGYDAGGTLRGQVSMTIPSLGKFESKLSELFSSVGDLDGGHVEVVSSEPLVGQELVSTGEALAALPAQARPLRNRLFSPHLASGGSPSFFTEVQLVNPHTTASTAVLTAVGDNGEILGSTSITLEPKETWMGRVDRVFGFRPAEMDPNLTTGSVVIDGSQVLLGNVLFGELENRRFLSALSLVSSSESSNSLLFAHIANGVVGGVEFFTGLALMNLASSPAQVTVRAFSPRGVLRAEKGETIPAGGRLSRLLDELMPALGVASAGFVTVASSQPVLAFQLFGDTSLNFLAAIPAIQP